MKTHITHGNNTKPRHIKQRQARIISPIATPAIPTDTTTYAPKESPPIGLSLNDMRLPKLA